MQLNELSKEFGADETVTQLMSLFDTLLAEFTQFSEDYCDMAVLKTVYYSIIGYYESLLAQHNIPFEPFWTPTLLTEAMAHEDAHSTSEPMDVFALKKVVLEQKKTIDSLYEIIASQKSSMASQNTVILEQNATIQAYHTLLLAYGILVPPVSTDDKGDNDTDDGHDVDTGDDDKDEFEDD